LQTESSGHKDLAYLVKGDWLFDRFALSTGYQPYVDLTVGTMNHQWYDAQVGQGSSDASGAGLKLAQQGSSASSGPAPQAEEGHPHIQGQPTFSSLGAGTGAGGNFCDLGQIANDNLGKISGQEYQGNEVVKEDELRNRLAAEVAKDKLRADAEARRAVDSERDRVTFVDQLPLQDLQAKAAHYEALARQNQKILDEQDAQAVKDWKDSPILPRRNETSIALKFIVASRNFEKACSRLLTSRKW
jgi:hypothetical protein